MDLSVVYSKTPKGLRARASLIGGLPSQLMKVLAHIDGNSKAQSILLKLDDITEPKLVYALNLLEREGYIKSVVVTRPSDDDWALTENFAPMEVEEVLSIEEAEAKAIEDARLAAQRKAKEEEDARLQAEIKAREEETKAREAEEQALEKAKLKEKLRAESKVKAQLEADRLTREKEEKRIKAEAEAQAKAQAKEEAQRKVEEERKAKAEDAARLEAERIAKAEEKTKVEEAARLAAEADAKAKIEQKEHVRREIERIARETEEAEQNKAEAKAIAKGAEEARLEADRKAKEMEEQARAKAEAARLEAEDKAKAAEEARQLAELKIQVEAKQALEKVEAEAKENTRRELLRIAHEVESAQKKAEEERKVKAEQEAQLAAQIKAEAEEKAQAKALAEEKAKEAEKSKAKDRNEIARIVREAEEARKKTEAQAKEERLEAKRKVKEEQEAQRKVERKPKVEEKQAPAKSEPEETVNVDANLQASLAMQQFASDVEDESKKSKAEEKAKEEQLETKRKAKAEQEVEIMRARVEAEDKAKVEEKERAQLEMERISREADEARQTQAAETHANVIVSAPQVVKSKSWEEIEAEEERAFAEEEAGISHAPLKQEVAKQEVELAELKAEGAEKHIEGEESVGRVIEKITQEETDRLGREEIKRLAKEEAELLAKTYAKRSARLLSYGKLISKANKAIKPLLIYSPLVIALLIGLLHFVNLSMLVAPIEKLAAASLGEPVSINQVRASLWPQPHLALKNVMIGANSELKTEGLKIDSINAYLSPSALFDEVKLVKSLEFEGLKITHENFVRPQQWVNNLGIAKHLKIAQISLKKIVLQVRDLEIGTFDGKVELATSGELKGYHLTSNTLSAQITPQGSSFDVVLAGTNWPLPMNQKLVFDDFKATGVLTQSQINFSQIDGSIYGGSIKAKAAVDWSSEWSAAGNFELANATLPRLLSAFANNASVDGKLELTGLFSSRSAQAAQLVDAPEITASFELSRGKINNIDLARAVLFKGRQSLVGGATQFNKLSGNLQLVNGRYQYKQVVLEAEQFRAKGNVNVEPNQDISGNISASLDAQSRRLQSSFNLAGKVGAVQRQ